MAFKWEGFLVQQSFNGKEGLEAFYTFKPDVVLLDIMMPEMDGNEVLKHIKKDKDHPLVIIFSNLQWPGETSEKVRYIKKSNVTPTEMVERVKGMM